MYAHIQIELFLAQILLSKGARLMIQPFLFILAFYLDLLYSLCYN